MPIKQKVQKGTGNLRKGNVGAKRNYQLIDVDGEPVTKNKIIKSPGGRKPIILTNALRDRITTLVRQGNAINTAVRAAGISMDTFKKWMDRVSESNLMKVEDPKEMEALEPYMVLAEEVVQAAAEAEVNRVSLIDKAAQLGQWGAAAWWLERRLPERWGKRAFIHQRVEAHHQHVHVVADQILEDSGFTEDAIDLFESSTEMIYEPS